MVCCIARSERPAALNSGTPTLSQSDDKEEAGKSNFVCQAQTFTHQDDIASLTRCLSVAPGNPSDDRV